MLLILLSWIYILAISIVFGIAINALLKVFTFDSVIIIFLGFFGITNFTGFWAIFFAVNWQFHLVLLVFALVAAKVNGLAIRSYFENLKKDLKSLSLFFKVFLFIVTLLILAQCASPPFIIDNESYYIQTIKWLNEYGFVKGLVNLHLFLGQNSGWHLLQSAFNFSFLYANFNDLSGLCLLLGNYFAIVKLNGYALNNDGPKLNLIIGLFPIFNVFLFQFISGPSPDVAVYVIGIIIFYLFLKNYSVYNQSSFLSVCFLSFFIIIIKLSALYFLVLPLVLLVKQFVLAKKKITPILLTGTITALLIFIKNLIVTGNAIYPLASVEVLSLDWHLPKLVETYFHDLGLADAYNLTADTFSDASVIPLLKSWLLQTNLNGIFNTLIILLLIISPWFMLKRRDKKPWLIIYFTGLISLVFLFFFSPQYRFFFPFIIALSLFILGSLIQRLKIVNAFIGITLAATCITVLFSFNVFTLSDNDLHQNTSNFKLKYVIAPHSNSRYKTDYEILQLENTTLNTPTQIDFFWATGNTPIPALNKQQLEYFKTYFKVIPQQRSENLEDGFYSKGLE